MPSEPGRAGEARTSRSRGAATCASSGQTRRARTVDSSAGFALQSRLLHPQMPRSTTEQALDALAGALAIDYPAGTSRARGLPVRARLRAEEEAAAPPMRARTHEM